METEQVRMLLAKFQDGYDRRDQSRLDEFMELFSSGDDLELIGTNAVKPGGEEWCLGQAAVRELVGNDWKYWGEVKFDLAGARIQVRGETAWLSTTGTVTDTITKQERYEGYLEYLGAVLDEKHKTEEQKTLELVRLGNDIVLGLPLSETFVWPFRFTAVAVREDGSWLFQQLQFSFATTHSPDVRIHET